jgi:hypothetical protein
MPSVRVRSRSPWYWYIGARPGRLKQGSTRAADLMRACLFSGVVEKALPKALATLPIGPANLLSWNRGSSCHKVYRKKMGSPGAYT